MNTAIIVGAGKGKRLGSREKIFLTLNQKTILEQAIMPFELCSAIDEIVLVVRKENIEKVKEIIYKTNFTKVKRIISGGQKRQDSIYNALSRVSCDYVLVHDAARPLVSTQLIEDVLNAAVEHGAAIPAIPCKDTVKTGSPFVKKTLRRDNLHLVQTPQAFNYNILREAYDSAAERGFYGTDDASLVERFSHKIKIVKGCPENIKITVPGDLAVAETLLKRNLSTIEIKAYTKINLDLEILKKLPNGYHEIRSVFQAVDLYDTLTISKIKKGFHLTGTVATSIKKNLVTRAKKALEKFVKKKLPCKIHFIKNIPISSGLGGGSSNAAATLVGLNMLYNLDLSLEELTKIARTVGSDVPFFIHNTGTALVGGTGERIKPVKREPSKVYVLARPHKRINTTQMYEEYDKTGKTFFELAQKICPDITKVYNYFNPISDECGMSGSGPTIFAGFNSYDKALEAVERFGVDKFNGDIFICKPVMNTYDIIRKQEND